tara:strand:- start:1307 stop:1681 length:375 start_codon:yes stop_codon:yes gene_type:complete
MDLKKYLLISILVVAIDAVYLNSISNYFNKQIKAIQGSKIRLNIPATILCYLIITLGIYYFMIERKFSLKEMAILGVFSYGIYETTNKALFNNWFWKTVLLDGIWGGILFALVHYSYHKLIHMV